MVICGLKSDGKREVEFDRAQELAETYGYPFIEVSSLLNINVNELFDKVLELIITKREDQYSLLDADNNKKVKLEEKELINGEHRVC